MKIKGETVGQTIRKTRRKLPREHVYCGSRDHTDLNVDENIADHACIVTFYHNIYIIINLKYNLSIMLIII